jgi:SAM-dependent methyltransferase
VALFRFQHPADYRRIRDTLAGAGYDDRGVSELLGMNLSAVAGKKLPALLRRTAGGTPLDTLCRLFILGAPVGLDPAGAALGEPEWWAAGGLVTIDGDRVQATVQLRCYQGLIVAFDFHRRGGAPLAADYVMGISASSLTLAGLTVRRPSRSTLDLGTGSGFQAFLAAQHSQRVVATDRNPRAVEIATFNAALNDLDALECRHGDLFDPVAGETFDLIVSNPPFIVSPDSGFYFLHGGMQGDDVCRTIARTAPAHLNPGGYCQFLANWAVGPGEDWRRRLAGWFEGTGCDAFVLRRGTTAADEYAGIWIEDDDFDASFEEWMRYYERLGIAAVDSGLVTMRRPAGATPAWFRAEDCPETMTFPAGDDLLRRFEAEDYLAAHPADDALRATRFRLAADARLDQQLVPAEGGWGLLDNQLRRTAGLHWSGYVDADGAEMLARCDGTVTMDALLAELAESVGPDAAELRASWPATVRRLVACGFLVPA